MGSAETSGVRGKGFQNSGAGTRGHTNATSTNVDQPASGLSTLTRTVSLCALAALILFVGHDCWRTLGETDHELAFTADMVASQLTLLPENDAATILARVPAGENAKRLHVLSDTGSTLASTKPALVGTVFDASTQGDQISVNRIIPGPIGSLVVSTNRTQALMPVIMRGAAGLAIAVAVILLTWRRRSHISPQYQTPISAVIDTAPFGIAVWDGTGTLQMSNRSFRRKLGKLPADLKKGLNYRDMRQAMLTSGHLETISDDEKGRCTEFHRKDGVCLMLDEMPLPDDGFITLVSDYTEQRDMEARLHAIHGEHRAMEKQLQHEIARAEAASQAKSSFLAHLSHEIRTPLNHIIGFSDLICHQSYGPIGDKRYANYVRHIKQSGELLLSSFSEILELAELESGAKLLRREEVMMTDLLMQAQKRHVGEADKRGVALVVQGADKLSICGDGHCLNRMICNIVENAVRYTPKGGRVTLAAWEAEDGVVLEISDTGVGISAERLESLGQAFVPGDAVFKRDRDGAGLGLAISRTIAELSGGSLMIDSTPDMGTTVAIALPLDAARQAARSSTAHAA